MNENFRQQKSLKIVVYENECVVLVIKTFSLMKVSNFRLVNDLSKTEIFS